MTDDFREILFDIDIGKNSEGGARWSTDIAQPETPNESRNENWAHALWEWDLRAAIRTEEQWLYVFHFFNGVAHGRAYGFRFRDRVINAATDAQYTDLPLLGTGDGTIDTFQIKRNLGISPYLYAMPINKPVADTVKIYIDETEIPDDHATLGWSVDTTTGLVTFDSAAAIFEKEIYCDFDFHFPVRFDVDSLASTWMSFKKHKYDIPLMGLKPKDYTIET